MKTEINPGYGWIICAHDDPEREECYCDLSMAWEKAMPIKVGQPNLLYRKRPLAPDGKRFSDPECEWKMVVESEVMNDGDEYAMIGCEAWNTVRGLAGCSAQSHNQRGLSVGTVARRKPAAQQSSWRYFATDGAPKEGDYPVVARWRDGYTSLFQTKQGTWNDGWSCWCPIVIPPLPPAKSEAELALEKYKDGKIATSEEFNDGFTAGYNAAKSKEGK